MCTAWTSASIWSSLRWNARPPPAMASRCFGDGCDLRRQTWMRLLKNCHCISWTISPFLTPVLVCQRVRDRCCLDCIQAGKEGSAHIYLAMLHTGLLGW